MRKIIAVDFDGCLCSHAYPEVGKPYFDIIEKARGEQLRGAKLILWTCREGKELELAVQACKLWGLEFDAINDNIPELIDEWGNNSRKVEADEYWDDRAVLMKGER